MLGLSRVRWALRKMSLPVNADALVLDVGSGGNPYPRSDVLLDRIEGAEHRNGDSMVIDRAAVFADATNMPFKDKSFDFVVASHILEHMSDPAAFLHELQRVAKAGYIETPNALFERLAPFDIHCLEILEVDKTLRIFKKSKVVHDDFLGCHNMLDRGEDWGELMHQFPEMFHVRYFWNEEISFVIENAEISCDWIENIYHGSTTDGKDEMYPTGGRGWRGFGLWVLNLFYAFRRNKRLKTFDLCSILRCPQCKGDLTKNADKLACQACAVEYNMIGGVPEFLAPKRLRIR